MEPVNINLVTRVLLADGWHDILYNSYEVGSFELADDDGILATQSRTPGFQFTDSDERFLAGPLSSVLAVEWGRSTDESGDEDEDSEDEEDEDDEE